MQTLSDRIQKFNEGWYLSDYDIVEACRELTIVINSLAGKGIMFRPMLSWANTQNHSLRSVANERGLEIL